MSKTGGLSIFLVLLVICFGALYSCKDREGSKAAEPEDPAAVALGEKTFRQSCSGCHNFQADGIGPQLSGIAGRYSREWLSKFIKSPEQAIKSGDTLATQLYKRFGVIMPSFGSLDDKEVNGVIAFMATHPAVAAGGKRQGQKGLADPIPEKIQPTDLAIDLTLLLKMPVSSPDHKEPLARITKLAALPSTNELFVDDLNGVLYSIKDGHPNAYLDIRKRKPKFIDRPGLATGLGSFALHPEFEKNGIFYTSHTESPGSGKADFAYADSIRVTVQWVLTEWKANDPKATSFSGTERELLRINFVEGIHGMQEIAFNPYSKRGDADYGLLYFGVGDGGSVENHYPFLAHSKEKVWGTVLRIDPAGHNSANGKYGIPAQNPFDHDTAPGTVREIYAYGFRNPHRLTWTKEGKLIVSNVGQANIESLNQVESGHDYGWPMREGTFVCGPYGDINQVNPLPADDSLRNITYPVAQFDHDEGHAISGGFEYTGNSLPALKGKFLFGDIPSGRLFFVDVADIKQGRQAVIREWQVRIDGKTKTLKEICAGGRVDLHFGKDANGELYIMTKADGSIYRLGGAK